MFSYFLVLLLFFKLFLLDLNRVFLIQDSILRHFSVVSQESFFFNTTIRENLLFANRNATEEDLDRVCQLASIDGKIRSLEKGYDTIGKTVVLKKGKIQSRRKTKFFSLFIASSSHIHTSVFPQLSLSFSKNSRC